MELDNIPDAFLSKLRLTILSALLTGKKSFPEIKRITGATDGNISAQAAKLEADGFLTINKKIVGKKPVTTYAITDHGRNEFREYVDLLENIIIERKKVDEKKEEIQNNRDYNNSGNTDRLICGLCE